MEIERICLDYSIFDEYLKKLQEFEIPDIYGYDYKINSYKKRAIIKYYQEMLEHYPLKENKIKKEKITNVKRKTKKITNLLEVNDLVYSGIISVENSVKCCYAELSIVSSLLNNIVINQMANDYNDETLESVYLWYSLQLQQMYLETSKYTKDGIQNGNMCHEIIENYALASVLYKRFQTNQKLLIGDIHKIVVDNSGLNQLRKITNKEKSSYKDVVADMLLKYNVKLDSEIIDVLDEQCKKLVMSSSTH